MPITWILIIALLAVSALAAWALLSRRRLLERISRQREELAREHHARDLLNRDLGELRIGHEMLERSLAVSESSARTKHEFLANMSHEIRTPLNGVLGMSEVLLSGNLDPREQRDMVRAMQTSGQALLRLIDDILSLSKLEAGRIELEHRTVDVHILVEDMLESFARDAYAKGIALSASLVDAPRRVRVDSLRLRQILANLLSNALKFTRRGEIMVRARQEGPNRLLFEVRDTGIGIPKAKQDQLFDAFTQADLSTSRHFGGTGLGLAISRRLVQLMDGAIQVESEPGAGSSFTFSVVVDAVHEDGLESPAHLVGRRVLLIDPFPWHRRNLAGLIESLGLVAEAHERTEEARGFQADYLLVSRRAEDPARALAELGGGAACFLTTSIADTVGRANAGELGFDGVVSLPVHRDRLLATLEPAAAGRTETVDDIAERSELLALRLPLRILVAEDNAVNQLVAEELLRVLGYRPDMAESGREVLTRLETADYDVIFMDVVMPDMDGLQTTRKIRSSLPSGRQPRIIALTAGVMEEQRDACREAGMDDFLAKPMQLESTREVLERLFHHVAEGRRPAVSV